MNVENLKIWTTALRDPANKQAHTRLGRVDDDGTKRYCCLGLGSTLVPGIAVAINGLTMEFDGACSVAPTAFHDWLGIKSPEHTASSDVHVDWPTSLTDREGFPYRTHLSCVELNDDAELTFPQIADVLDYFGVVGSS